jgi:AcrR family transcriptional regulator
MADSGAPSLREERRAHEQARRRADALAGATAVFAEKGFHEAQMTEIAAAAELSRASLYALFEGKDELYGEVIRTSAERMWDAVRARVESVPDAGARLLTLIDALFDCFEENRDLLRIVLSGTQGFPGQIRKRLGEPGRSVEKEFRNWAVELCRDAARVGALRGVDPEAAAISLYGAVLFVADRTLDSDSGRSAAQLAAGVREVFSRVLAGDSGEPA